MLMTTGKLLALRVLNVTLGRLGILAELFKRALIWRLVARSKKKYTASANFFDIDDLAG